MPRPHNWLENFEATRPTKFLTPTEFDEFLDKIRKVDYLELGGDAWQALFCVFWIFGKRISETVSIRTRDVRTDNSYLYITFHVRKKPKGKNPRITKRITLRHLYVPLILKWLEKMNEKKEPFLFPRPQTKLGHIYPQYVWNVIQKVDMPIFTHLFRRSLATKQAEEGATVFELCAWFDWERVETARSYVDLAGNPKATRRFSERIV